MQLVDTSVQYTVVPSPVIQVNHKDNQVTLTSPYPNNTLSLINAHPQVSRAVDWDKKNNTPGVITITYKDDPRPICGRLCDILETSGYTPEVNGLPKDDQVVTIIPPSKNDDRLFELGQDIQIKLDFIAKSSRAIAVSWWEIGRSYAEAQRIETDKGRFLCWVESNSGHSSSTVYRLIDIYKRYSYEQIAQMGDVSQSVLLALSDTSDEVKEQAVAMLESGEKLTKSTAEELKVRHGFLETLPEELQKAYQQSFNGITKEHIQALYPLQGLDVNGLSRKTNFDLLFDTPHPHALYARMVKDGLEVRQVESVVNRILVYANYESEDDIDLSEFDDDDFDGLEAKGGVMESTPTGVANWRWQVVNGESVAVNTVTGDTLEETQFEQRKEELRSQVDQRTKKRKANQQKAKNRTAENNVVKGATWAANATDVAGAMSEAVDRVNKQNEKRDQLTQRFFKMVNGLSVEKLAIVEQYIDDLQEDLKDLGAK